MSANFVLIDDSEMDLYIHQKCIERELPDSEILTFIRAGMALAFLDSSKPASSHSSHWFVPNFILVDSDMPEMNGIEFLDAFAAWKDSATIGTKVFMLSYATDPNLMASAENHPACDGFISKPFTPEKLRKIVLEAVPELK
ncbi:response regulator [Robiginitalea sp. SC105]|uniref:response regulator n=1 Tax=Robiginitalea sp. SC105 TaxID=2762332 RepID=UPI0016399694|nr:response regulator [Robiginitalea sp. SC105]MBC2840405.1 response regulator [Robiginitalea sp. SC105]